MNADDDFGFTTTISFFDDTKRYNQKTEVMSKLEDKVNEILGVDHKTTLQKEFGPPVERRR